MPADSAVTAGEQMEGSISGCEKGGGSSWSSTMEEAGQDACSVRHSMLPLILCK